MLRLLLCLMATAVAGYGIDDTKMWHTMTSPLYIQSAKSIYPSTTYQNIDPDGTGYRPTIFTTTTSANAVLVELGSTVPLTPLLNHTLVYPTSLSDIWGDVNHQINRQNIVGWAVDATNSHDGSLQFEAIYPLINVEVQYYASQVGAVMNRVPITTPSAFISGGNSNTGQSGQLSWSVAFQSPPYPAVGGKFMLDMCVDSSTQCSGRGRCGHRPLNLKTNIGVFFLSSIDPTFGLSNVLLQLDGSIESYDRDNYNIRGCFCKSGYYGLACETQCPTDPRDVCINRGTCIPAAGKALTWTDDSMDTCVCTGACKCDSGYTGKYCENAIQAPPQPMTMKATDFSICCPNNSTDCTQLRSFTSTDRPTTARIGFTDYVFCVQTNLNQPPQGQQVCTGLDNSNVWAFETGVYNDVTYYEHVNVTTPFVNNINPEGVYDPCDSLQPDQYIPITAQYADLPVDINDSVDGNWYLGSSYDLDLNAPAVVGRGVCAIDRWKQLTLTKTPTRSMCFCNAPLEYAQNGGLLHLERRGWFPGYDLGTGAKNPDNQCKARTCTQKFLPVWDGSKWVSQLALVPSNRIIKQIPSGKQWILAQCNGYHAPELADGQNVPNLLGKGRLFWPLTSTICDDRSNMSIATDGSNVVPTLINREGDCVKCQHGFGAVKGLSRQKVYNYTALYSSGATGRPENGLCREKTFHSDGGLECGGFGHVTYVDNATATAMMTQGGVNASDNHALLMPIASCKCEWPYTIPWNFTDPLDGSALIDTGVCLRTCSGTYYNVTSIRQILNATSGQFDNAPVDMAVSTACGGPLQGFCRPILDGFNSACLCNIGWKGYDCKTVDNDIYDDGLGEVGYTNPPSGGYLCGSYGQSRPKTSPINTTGLAGEVNYFYGVVAKMQPSELGNNTKAYTGYECFCTASAPPGYDTNNTKGVCAKGCNALIPAGTTAVCGGHGTCVSGIKTVSKQCVCDLGWNGDMCDTPLFPSGPDYHNNSFVDNLGGDWGACGGPSRGLPVYNDYSAKYKGQSCACMPGYINSDLHSCFKPCPANCSGYGNCRNQTQGYIDSNTGLGVAAYYGDGVCECLPGRDGVACELPLACSVVLQHGTYSACAGYGQIDEASGMCVCNPGYVGACCELPIVGYNATTQTLDCGVGQPYVDNYSRNIKLVGPLGATAYVQPVPVKCGYFSVAGYLTQLNMTTIDAFAYLRSTSNRNITLDTGASGLYDIPHNTPFVTYAQSQSSVVSTKVCVL